MFMDLDPPKFVKRKKVHKFRDIEMTSMTPSIYGHMARDPNTNYHVQLLQYKQRYKDMGKEQQEREAAQIIKDCAEIKYQSHAEKNRIQRQVRDRLNLKIKEHEDSVNERRERLREFLAQEERELYWETIDKAQRGADKKMGEMKQRAEQLRARREAERLQLVEEKKIQQYRDRCMDLRTVLAQKHLKESKSTQLQQIRENEARREADRELERMWLDMARKEDEAKRERERQDVIRDNNCREDLMSVWNMQVQGKELLKREAEQVAEEDRIEMMKLQEQLRQEEIEAEEKKRREGERRAKELLEQKEMQDRFAAQRKQEEEALEKAFAELARLEIEREQQAVQDTTLQARRETYLYRKHIEALQKERKEEDEKLLALLEEHRKEIEEKKIAEKCKYENARRKLQEDVLRQRAEQLEYKRKEAEEEAKRQEEERQLVKMSYDTIRKLKGEHVRRQKEDQRKYGEDLRMQIEYNRILKQREIEEAERQVRAAQEEDEKYRTMVENYVTGRTPAEDKMKHPFRCVLERHDCYCPRKTHE